MKKHLATTCFIYTRSGDWNTSRNTLRVLSYFGNMRASLAVSAIPYFGHIQPKTKKSQIKKKTQNKTNWKVEGPLNYTRHGWLRQVMWDIRLQ